MARLNAVHVLVIVGGVWLTVDVGRTGQLPEFMQTALHNLMPGTFPPTPGTTTTKQTTPSVPTTGTKSIPASAYDFIRGQRYVDFDPNTGRYFVYWYGSVTYFNTQTEAERAYNRLVEAYYQVY